MEKVNALEGDWTGSLYAKHVRPMFQRENLPLLKHKELPFTHLHNDEFWGNLRSSPPDIVSLDHRLWLYDEDTFVVYANRIASIPLKIVCLFESPLGYERPLSMSIKTFQRCLSNRTKTFVNIVKGRQPSATILSPAVRVINPDIQNILLDYLMHHRSYFDGYAVHCCLETTAHSLGALTGFINQVLSILRKPIWVTRWSVPSHDSDITSSKMLNPSDWSPLSTRLAGLKLKTAYSTINEISPDSKWFFVGTGQDVYHPDKVVPVWGDCVPYKLDSPKGNWEAHHFLGTVDHSGNLKTEVLDAFLSIAN